MVVRRSSPVSQLGEPTTQSVAASWDEIHAGFSSIIRPVHLRLCSVETEPAEAVNTFSALLRALFEWYVKKEGSRANKSVLHCSRKIEKVTERLKNIKKKLGKVCKSKTSQFFNVHRAHNKCLNAQQSYVHAKDLQCL